MAVESPTNEWTLAEQALVDALPECSSFRDICGAANAAAAAAYVYLDAVPSPADKEAYTQIEREGHVGYAVVSSSTDGPYQTNRGFATDAYEPRGTITILFDRYIAPTEYTESTEQLNLRKIDRWFKNRVGNIHNELSDYWETNGDLWMVTYSVTSGPFRNKSEDQETQSEWQWCMVSIDWGIGLR